MRFASRLLVIAVMLGVASCGQCGSNPPAAPNVDLVFTGPVAGAMKSAKTQCEVYPSQAQLNFHFTGVLGGQDLELNRQIHSGYQGPDTYKIGSLLDGSGELRLQAGSYVGATATGAGTVTVSSDGKSGSLDSDLSGGEHVKGTFRCDEVIQG